MHLCQRPDRCEGTASAGACREPPRSLQGAGHARGPLPRQAHGTGWVPRLPGLQQGQPRTPPWSDDTVCRRGRSAQAAPFLTRAPEASLGRGDKGTRGQPGRGDDVAIRRPCGCGLCPRPAGTRDRRVRLRSTAHRPRAKHEFTPAARATGGALFLEAQERSYSAA